jgi:hypothetical protein
MRGKTTILAVLGAAVAAVLLGVFVFDGGGDAGAEPARAEVPGTPSVEFISPRNGAVQRGTAVVVKVAIENFKLAPRHFGGEPRLGEGSIRFSLNRVPDCVDPEKLQKAEESAIGKGRLVGTSFDSPEYAGPNGVLGARIGSTGSYSPATRPEIFYSNLPPGFYRLVVVLAANDGSTSPYHDVTNFQILEKPGHQIADCVGGKISSAKAAAAAAED